MPPVTGYESDEEWAEKTSGEYGQEWRQRLGVLGMCLGAIGAGAILLGRASEMNRGQARLLAGVGAVVGMAVGAALGWAVGYVIDANFNPRYRKKHGKPRRGRPRPRRRSKKGFYDIE